MMVVGAFNQVQQSLRWFVDNFSSIADWRATLFRVASFRKAIFTIDELDQTEIRINFAETEGPSIKIDGLHIASPRPESPCTVYPVRLTAVRGKSGVIH